MAAESSELPTHYGGKTADGEVVTRPDQDLTVTSGPIRSPSRAYDRNRPLSPQVTPIDFEFLPGDRDRDDRPRYRQSAQPRRNSHSADNDRPYLSDSRDSQRPLRARDDGYYREREEDRDYRRDTRRDSRDRERERERDEYRHPDLQESRRPPRAHRNFDRESVDYNRPNKATYEYTDRDYEPRSRRRSRSPDEEESIDGYNYDAHKGGLTIDFKNLTKEEKSAMMRLPWTQWMNSSFKNREYINKPRISSNIC